MNLTIPSFRLDGRRALVSGVSSGIGLAIAQGLSAMGAEVTLCARNQKPLETAVAELVAAGFKAQFLVCDVTQTEAFNAKLEQLPTFDILVNNVGTNDPKPLTKIEVADYERIMNLNLRSVFFTTKAVTGRLLAEKKRGSIINISSQMGHVGARHRTLYCASKWAIEGFTKALAVELAPNGIRVNSIAPTFIETPLTKPFLENPDFYQEVISKLPIGHLGQVSDIVGAAVFLASDASSLMTGSAVLLDGGWTAQ